MVESVNFLQEWAAVTISKEGKKAELWLCDETDSKWCMSKSFQHMNQTPQTCSLSKDKSILAFSYEDVVVLYDFRTLHILTYLQSKEVQQPITSMKFYSRYFIGTNSNGLFIWDLIQLQLLGKYQAENVELIHASQEKILFKCDQGIFTLDQDLKAKKLFDLAVNMKFATLAHHNRIYFISQNAKNQGHSLRYFNIGQKRITENIGDQNRHDKLTRNLQANMEELKINVEENIYQARQGPSIDPEMITKKVSLSSESIIKRALPI